MGHLYAIVWDVSAFKQMQRMSLFLWWVAAAGIFINFGGNCQQKAGNPVCVTATKCFSPGKLNNVKTTPPLLGMATISKRWNMILRKKAWGAGKCLVSFCLFPRRCQEESWIINPELHGVGRDQYSFVVISGHGQVCRVQAPGHGIAARRDREREIELQHDMLRRYLSLCGFKPAAIIYHIIYAIAILIYRHYNYNI